MNNLDNKTVVSLSETIKNVDFFFDYIDKSCNNDTHNNNTNSKNMSSIDKNEFSDNISIDSWYSTLSYPVDFNQTRNIDKSLENLDINIHNNNNSN